ncbi:hypothetical protein [Streptomyces sp. NPDC004830]
MPTLAVSAFLLLGVACSGGAAEDLTRDMSTAELSKWGEGIIDCSVPGLGVEMPLAPVRSDVSGDGKDDVIVSLECVTGDASSFSHVVALDGASAAEEPTVLGTLVSMPRTKDYRRAVETGAKVRKITVRKDLVTVVADQWRYMDAKACPSRKYVQIFRVEDGKLSGRAPSRLDVTTC